MRRGRIILYLALIIIVGVVGAAAALLRQQSPSTADAQATPTPEVITTNVVVVVQPVSRGQEITTDMVGMVPIPEELVVQGWITDPGVVVGKRAKFDLEPGTLLTEGLLAQSLAELSATGSEAALQIPPGMVAVAIPMDRLSSVAYGIRDGDHVNVIVTLLFTDLDAEFQSRLPNLTASVQGAFSGGEGSPPLLTAQIQAGGPLGPVVGRASLDSTLVVPIYEQPSEAPRPRMVSQMLLQDVIVLHVGNFEEKKAAAPTPTPTPGGEEAQPQPQPAAQPEQAPLPPDIITLVVSPQDALTLNWLMMQGARLSLALRAANDTSRVQTEAVTLQYLTSAYNIPVPAKLPYGLEPRVDELAPPTLPNDQQQQQTGP